MIVNLGQSVNPETSKPWVGGSNPSWRTKKIKEYSSFSGLLEHRSAEIFLLSMPERQSKNWLKIHHNFFYHTVKTCLFFLCQAGHHLLCKIEMMVMMHHIHLLTFLG